MSHRVFALAVKASNDALDLSVYDAIGKDPWTGEGVTSKDVKDALAGFKGSTINVRINSGGGNVFDGIAIYNLLREHKARVVVDVDGLAASAASVIAMAGDEIRVAKSAFLMIHRAWSGVMGNAQEIRARADMLEKIDQQMAALYADARMRRGIECTADECMAMMSAETWMSGEEAMSMGFADDVGPEMQIAASFEGLNPPAHVLARTHAHGKDDDMSKLIEALGAKDEIEALAIVEVTTEEMQRLKAQAEEFAPKAETLAKVEETLGASGEALLGAVVALKDASVRLEAVSAELEELKVQAAQQAEEAAKAAAEREHNALVDQGLADGAITPGLEPWARSVSTEVLRGFLAQAPRVIPSAGTKPLSQPAVPSSLDSLTDDDKAVAAQMGISLEAFAKVKAESTRSNTDEE